MERKRNEFIGSRPPVTPLDLSDNKIQIGNGKVIVSPRFFLLFFFPSTKLNGTIEEKGKRKGGKRKTKIIIREI